MWQCNGCSYDNPDNRSICWGCSLSKTESLSAQYTKGTQSDADDKIFRETEVSASSKTEASKNIKSLSEFTFTTPEQPSYLNFLRVIAGLNLVVGILGTCAFLFSILKNLNSYSFEPTSYAWVISLAIALEGFLAYGLLNAIADITENMIDVGTYVKDLKRKNKD